MRTKGINVTNISVGPEDYGNTERAAKCGVGSAHQNLASATLIGVWLAQLLTRLPFQNQHIPAAKSFIPLQVAIGASQPLYTLRYLTASARPLQPDIGGHGN
jgi:hypothetical protein